MFAMRLLLEAPQCWRTWLLVCWLGLRSAFNIGRLGTIGMVWGQGLSYGHMCVESSRVKPVQHEHLSLGAAVLELMMRVLVMCAVMSSAAQGS